MEAPGHSDFGGHTLSTDTHVILRTLGGEQVTSYAGGHTYALSLETWYWLRVPDGFTLNAFQGRVDLLLRLADHPMPTSVSAGLYNVTSSPTAGTFSGPFSFVQAQASCGGITHDGEC